MIDNSIPTNQFHPYQPPDATPQTQVSPSGLSSMLKRVGIDQSRLGKMRDVNLRQSMGSARGYAQRNPAKVLGGLAALAIGLGMMRGRWMR